VLLLRPLAEILAHPIDSPLPFRQVVELVWAVVKEHRLQEPERRNCPRGSTVALKSMPALMRLLGLPEGVNAGSLQVTDLIKYLRQHVRPADGVPVQIVHRFNPPEKIAYDVQFHEQDPMSQEICQSFTATATAPEQFATLDAELRATLDQLRTRALKRSWLRSLLHKPGSAAAVGSMAVDYGGAAVHYRAGSDGAEGSGAGSHEGADSSSDSYGGALRSLEALAPALLEAQAHVNRHALTPAARQPRGTVLRGDSAVRSAVPAFFKA